MKITLTVEGKGQIHLEGYVEVVKKEICDSIDCMEAAEHSKPIENLMNAVFTHNNFYNHSQIKFK